MWEVFGSGQAPHPYDRIDLLAGALLAFRMYSEHEYKRE
jgi:hypothetical protein